MTTDIHVSTHPLILHKLSQLRDKSTAPPQFRLLVRELSQLLFVEASSDLSVQSIEIETPVAKCQAHQISERFALIPILRAGLGMAESILELAPDASVWHLGLERDEKTLQPKTYYNRLSEKVKIDTCFVVDPMLATGGSAVHAVKLLKGWEAKRIKFLGLIAAPEGVKNLRQAHPDVPIYLAALDEKLNEVGYIVPGLGDAGDRQFGTF